MNNNPLLDRFALIKFIQDSIEEPTEIQKLFNTFKVRDTIPIIIYLKNGEPFYSYGNVGMQKGSECFYTPFFRIDDIDQYLIKLNLLKPTYKDNNPSNTICDTVNLQKTKFCIEVTIDIFGGVQFLNPSIVN